MDLVIRNQGLQHISEEIFLNLDQKSLTHCENVNQIWAKVLNNPSFWLKKCVKKGLLEHFNFEWMKLIQSSKPKRIDNMIKSYLMKIYSESNADYSPIHAAFIHGQRNIPEFIRFAAPILDNPNDSFPTLALAKKVFSRLSYDIQLMSWLLMWNWKVNEKWTPIQLLVYHDYVSFISPTEIVAILAPLTQNPNAPDPDGWTPINRAARRGNFEIIRIIAPLTDNPNMPDPKGLTPILQATKDGNSEIVRILAPLTDNSNASDSNGWTPIFWAAKKGNSEIVRILAPLTDDPNAPDSRGWTPISLAANNGNSEIVRILAQLTDNPNAPGPDGCTPILLAAEYGNSEIVRILHNEAK